MITTSVISQNKKKKTPVPISVFFFLNKFYHLSENIWENFGNFLFSRVNSTNFAKFSENFRQIFDVTKLKKENPGPNALNTHWAQIIR